VCGLAKWHNVVCFGGEKTCAVWHVFKANLNAILGEERM